MFLLSVLTNLTEVMQREVLGTAVSLKLITGKRKIYEIYGVFLRESMVE